MTDTPNTTAGANPKEARVLEQHLDPAYTFSAEFDPQTPYSDEAPGSSSNSVRPEIESSLQLQGGDIHRDLYKIAGQARRQKLHQRAATFSHTHEFAPPSEPEFEHDGLPIQDQLQPGGMRRQFLQRQSKRVSYISEPVTRNFISFLDLYGQFAGEDLGESDDEDAIEEEEESNERRPLLGRRQSSRRMRERGDAGQVKTFFTLLKAFIGTGIMFLPKAFKNGGMLFSSITMIVVSIVTALCFELLLSCRKQYGGAGYGDLGRSISGPKLRSLILVSITMSQIGFVCAGLIFTADNLASFFAAVTKGQGEPLSTSALIGIQLIILIPMSFIRNISKLGPAALLADVFILIGLTYIYWYDISWISKMGGFHPSIELFNPRDFTMTIGAAIFTFEGIGLILPIQSSMKQPEHFSKLLYVVMLLITVIFTSVGVLCYGTFGKNVSVEVIDNFPQSSKLVNAVQFLYAMAVLVGTPVQLFPAMRNIELKIFGRASGKQSNMTKWKKNAFRSSLVLLCGLIAAVGDWKLCVRAAGVHLPSLLALQGCGRPAVGEGGRYCDDGRGVGCYGVHY
jgi:proton-coupled amino acid transporter